MDVPEKPGYRTKTIATRTTPEELAEVEAAAQRDGKSIAEWLRELALKTARQRPVDPMELLLSEVAATRYMLLNLFHATAQANGEGKHLLTDSVLKIRDQADARKLRLGPETACGFRRSEGCNRGQILSRPMKFPSRRGRLFLLLFGVTLGPILLIAFRYDFWSGESVKLSHALDECSVVLPGGCCFMRSGLRSGKGPGGAMRSGTDGGPKGRSCGRLFRGSEAGKRTEFLSSCASRIRH